MSFNNNLNDKNNNYNEKLIIIMKKITIKMKDNIVIKTEIIEIIRKIFNKNQMILKMILRI